MNQIELNNSWMTAEIPWNVFISLILVSSPLEKKGRYFLVRFSHVTNPCPTWAPVNFSVKQRLLVAVIEDPFKSHNALYFQSEWITIINQILTTLCFCKRITLLILILPKLHEQPDQLENKWLSMIIYFEFLSSKISKLLIILRLLATRGSHFDTAQKRKMF